MNLVLLSYSRQISEELLVIRFNGKILPYDNCSEWIADTRYLSGDLLWNEESKYLTTNAAYYESETWF